MIHLLYTLDKAVNSFNSRVYGVFMGDIFFPSNLIMDDIPKF